MRPRGQAQLAPSKYKSAPSQLSVKGKNPSYSSHIDNSPKFSSCKPLRNCFPFELGEFSSLVLDVTIPDIDTLKPRRSKLIKVRTNWNTGKFMSSVRERGFIRWNNEFHMSHGVAYAICYMMFSKLCIVRARSHRTGA